MLTRYIWREFLSVFFVSNLLIVFILTMFQMVRIAEVVLMKGSHWWEILDLMVTLMTTFLPASIPISCLASTNMIVGRMSQDSELIALITAGIPGRRLLGRFLMIGVILAVVMGWLSLSGVPQANARFNDKMSIISQRKADAAIPVGVFVEGFHGLLLYVEQTDKDTQDMKNVFVYDERDPKLPMVITSPRARLVKASDDVLSFIFDKGEIHVNRGRGNYQKIIFSDYQLNLPLQTSFDSVGHMPLGMDYPILKAEIEKARVGQSQWNKEPLELELYRRVFLPFACVLFIVVGFLWGLGHHRTIRGRPVVTSLLLTAVYWSVFLTFDSLGRKGSIPTLQASLIPNLVMLGLCFVLYAFKKRYV